MRRVGTAGWSVNEALPDGTAIRLTCEGPTGNWIVERVEDTGEPAVGRWLLKLLRELAGEGPGPVSPGLQALIARVAGRETAVGRRFPCSCCDHFTLEDAPTGTHAICDVCGWEDDALQHIDQDQAGGANRVSLRQARQNFKEFAASEWERKPRVRPSLPEERP